MTETMETMKASRRKQTKPNRNPFGGVDPQSGGSFNPSLLPPSRLPGGEDEEPHQGGAGRDYDAREEHEMMMARDGGVAGDFGRDMSHDEDYGGRRSYEREDAARDDPGRQFERGELSHDNRSYDRDLSRDGSVGGYEVDRERTYERDREREMTHYGSRGADSAAADREMMADAARREGRGGPESGG
ncbi:uncharacterized protein LOC143279687 [Babylonia areolata]|uniref:uncharacterized protein LOC143279687 n=1 Tax=Babylonia areolata TaxID=304850 RepID=UPI003FD4FC90